MQPARPLDKDTDEHRRQQSLSILIFKGQGDQHNPSIIISKDFYKQHSPSISLSKDQT